MAKYTVTIKYFLKKQNKITNIFKLLFLESLVSKQSRLKNRLLLTFADIIFNYKYSTLYKKKLVVYKKIFS